MRSSKNTTVGNKATIRRSADRGAARGLAALIGLGLCACAAEARAYPQAQAQAAPRQAYAARGPAVTRIKNDAKARLITAGAATLGGFWSASALAAGVMHATQAKRAEHPSCAFQTFCPRLAAPRSGTPASLLVPVVGPWIGLGTMPHTAAGAVGLTVLGVGQAVGVGLLIGGLTLPSEIRVTKRNVIEMHAAPLVGPDGLGLSIRGAM